MNNTKHEAEALCDVLAPNIGKDMGCDVVFCVPSIDIIPVIKKLETTNIAVGAQNMHFVDSGAYTGEISAKMLKEVGVKYVIIGHSERRQYFGETDESVNKKVIKAIETGLIPIICVGESLAQREQGITVELVRMQVKLALQGVTDEQAKNIVLAYEPIWAIGTGITATSAQAEEVCAAIRVVLGEIYSKELAEEIRIQYGGSVSADNAAELFAQKNIDGGLVGGASLKPEFEKIVKAAGGKGV
ncbi:triosephosphate isomerase [Holotrichia oblita]|nr:triosephosphate isomerase [Holotrichia oblita]